MKLGERKLTDQYKNIMFETDVSDTWSRNGRVLVEDYFFEVAEDSYDSTDWKEVTPKSDNPSNYLVKKGSSVEFRKRTHFPETWLWDVVAVRYGH